LILTSSVVAPRNDDALSAVAAQAPSRRCEILPGRRSSKLRTAPTFDHHSRWPRTASSKSASSPTDRGFQRRELPSPSSASRRARAAQRRSALLPHQPQNLPCSFGDSDARVGESIWSVGYPTVASSTDDVIGGWLSRDSDLIATFNPGIITAIKRNVTNTPVFQSNVAIYRGNSGGPVVNRAGEVVGISTWGRSDAESIKFLVPINVARAFLNEAHVRSMSKASSITTTAPRSMPRRTASGPWPRRS
jgi:hypothetical protein